MKTVKHLAGAVVAMALAGHSTSALGGEAATAAILAERAIENGDAAAALEQLDNAVEAIWDEMPLHLRTAVFAETGSIKAFGKYQPGDNSFADGDTVTVYLEPVGYGFRELINAVSIRLTTSVEIRSPGGIVYARAPKLGELSWQGRARSREIHGNVSLKLPPLKPGSYHLVIGLTDAATGNSTEASLPFDIAE